MQESIRNKSFTLLAATLMLLSVMACSDHGLAPINEGYISGTIRYVGQPPPSTVAVLLAFYRQYPPQNIIPPDDTLLVQPPYVDSTRYTTKLLAGRYEWVVLAWIPITGLPGLDTLGMYYDKTDLTRPGVVEVAPDDTLRDIDITADFSKLTQPSPILNKSNVEEVAWREE